MIMVNFTLWASRLAGEERESLLSPLYFFLSSVPAGQFFSCLMDCLLARIRTSALQVGPEVTYSSLPTMFLSIPRKFPKMASVDEGSRLNYLVLIRNLIHNGSFSQRVKIFCSAHSAGSSPSVVSRSKFQRSLASTNRTCISASRCPMQLRGPIEKGWRASR